MKTLFFYRLARTDWLETILHSFAYNRDASHPTYRIYFHFLIFFIGDYQNALASHKQCVDLVRTQLNDSLQEAREIGNVGAVYLAIGDFDKAVECHTEHLKLAESLNNQVEAARAYSNLGM